VELLGLVLRMQLAHLKSPVLREIFELALEKLELTRQLGILVQEHRSICLHVLWQTYQADRTGFHLERIKVMSLKESVKGKSRQDFRPWKNLP
jgi:hypothetical protein